MDRFSERAVEVPVPIVTARRTAAATAAQNPLNAFERVILISRLIHDRPWSRSSWRASTRWAQCRRWPGSSWLLPLTFARDVVAAGRTR